MPSGGARHGANIGRPPSVLTKTSRDDAVAATKTVNLTPIQVMAENMRFWYDAALGLTDQIKDALQESQDSGVPLDKETIELLGNNIKKMLFARERAQDCAEGMAPYRHPRLANIEVHAGFGDEPESDVPKITNKTTPKEAAALYEQVLRGGV